MKKIFYLIIIIATLQSCNTTKQAINNGNYDKATRLAIKKLIANKDRPKQIAYLEQAFNAANKKDDGNIQLLLAQNNAATAEQIYKLYTAIATRQSLVQQVLPLYNNKTSKDINLYWIDVTTAQANALNNTVQYNYTTAQNLLRMGGKSQAQQAYSHLVKVQQYNAQYPNINQEIATAKYAGTYYYNVVINYPDRYINDAFTNNWQTVLANNFKNTWAVYHINSTSTNYDATVYLNFDNVNIGREKEQIDNYIETKKIPDGYTWMYNKGNTTKDTTKATKIMLYKTVEARIQKISKYKEATINGIVNIVATNGTIAKQPISHTYTWSNIAARYKGDKNALTEVSRNYVNNAIQNFPASNWMVEQAHQVWCSQASTFIKSKL